MGGGLLQLKRIGQQDMQLIGNPQMTFFKTVYRRHTNFSMEMRRIDFEGISDLSFSLPTTFRCNIPRDGDLLSNLFFSISLPNIYSGYYTDDPNDVNKPGINIEFEWIPNLGTQIIKKTTLSIGGVQINEVYGAWIEIYNELFADTSEKNNFDDITGHDPSLFKPSHNGWNGGIYPSSSLRPEQNVNPVSIEIFQSNFKRNPFLQPPSIQSRQLYVPLPFFFSKHPGLALPLVALQYHEVFIEIECRPISELYTIIETRDFGDVPARKRTAPNPSFEHHHIGNFITSVPIASFTPEMDLTDGDKNLQGWNSNVHLLANYIFLDDQERTQFANNEHEYLIEQVTRQDFTGVYGSQSLKLNLNHPTKLLLWCAQRSDIGQKLNLHNNYTNWLDEFIPPNSQAYVELLGAEDEDPLYYVYENGEILIINGVRQTLDSDASGSRALLPTKFNFQTYEKEIVKKSQLIFDGKVRYEEQPNKFHTKLQSYLHKTRIDKSGINLYNFGLNPAGFQPNGQVNFSQISDIKLNVTVLDPPKKAYNAGTYDYNLFVYAINYNVLKIQSGMAGISYVN